MADIPAISGVDDASQVRVLLWQSGRQVHAPVLNIGLQPAIVTDTGWSPMTGAGSKAAIAAAAAGTASVGYVQAELQAALNRIAALEARFKALDAALIAHGLIGS